MATRPLDSALTRSAERPAATASGYPMLLALLAAGLVGLFDVLAFMPERPAAGGLIAIACAAAAALIVPGFYMLQPNQAAAITLFGSYKGTDRAAGLRWVLPWQGRRKLSVRSNNIISERIKVNDLRGNPIEIAAQVVWRVTDTAQALFDVENYTAFVLVKI